LQISLPDVNKSVFLYHPAATAGMSRFAQPSPGGSYCDSGTRKKTHVVARYDAKGQDELIQYFSVWRKNAPLVLNGTFSTSRLQPVDVFWSYRVTVSARTAAGTLPSLDWRPGTLSRIISGIRTLLWTTSSACWKRFCSQRTSAISALDVSRRCGLQIYILLTYLHVYRAMSGIW